MTTRKRRDELDAPTPRAPGPTTSVGGGAAQLLRLQATAGNSAVNSLLQRSGKPPPKPKKAKKSSSDDDMTTTTDDASMGTKPSNDGNNTVSNDDAMDVSSSSASGSGLAFTSSYQGGTVTPTVNSQTMLEWWVHRLEAQDAYFTELLLELQALRTKLETEKTSTGGLSAASVESVTAFFHKLASWNFNVNGVLEEAWNRSVIATRSGNTYAKVGGKFADNLRDVLREMASADPRWAGELGRIGTSYVNKHHLMLKSLHPLLQIAPHNLLHAGLGSASTGNSDFHKAMHELTALNGKLDYSTMDPDVAKAISAIIQVWASSPGHDAFQ